MPLSEDESFGPENMVNYNLLLDSISTKQVREQKSELDNEVEHQRQVIIDRIFRTYMLQTDHTAELKLRGTNPESLEIAKLLWQYHNSNREHKPVIEYIQKLSMAASEASCRLFHCLPREVLSTIVRHMITRIPKAMPPYYKIDFSGLKALRLSNRTFSYNYQLMKLLFRDVKLLGTISNIALLEAADPRKIAPYVQRLTFLPSFHSWVLTFDEFKEIIISQAAQKCCYDNDIVPHSGTFEMVENLYEILVSDYWGKELFSQTELEDGYVRHLEEAHRGRRLLDSQRLEDQWIRALTTWSSCRSYRIASQEYNGDEDDIPEEYTCEVYKHSHSYNYPHEDDTCRRSFQALGDRLFGAVVNCLSKSQTQPKLLELDFHTTGAYHWDALPGWEQLDLSRLETLTFDPQTYGKAEVSVLYDTEDLVPGERVCTALNGILQKCSSTITHLVHNTGMFGPSPLVWPGSTLIPLPELRSITFDQCIIDADQFAKLLPLLPKLEDFDMYGVHPKDEWRALFDAVRNHPKRLKLGWDLSYGHREDVRAYYNTGEIAHTPENEELAPYNEITVKVQRSLQNYLAGCGRWNKALRIRFDFEEDDGIDSEDEAIYELL